MAVTLSLPWPPSVNHYWRVSRGIHHVSREGRAYKARVASILAAKGIRPLDGPVAVAIEAFPPDRRRRDLDNIEKCLFDACAAHKALGTGLYHDDSQIRHKVSTMRGPCTDGRVVVTVKPWGGSGEESK